MISVSLVSNYTRMAVARTVRGDQVHQTTEETEYCAETLGENSNVEHSLHMSLEYDNYLYTHTSLNKPEQLDQFARRSPLDLLRLLPHRLGLVTLRQSPHISIVESLLHV